MGPPECFDHLREALRGGRGKPNREWMQIVGPLVDHSLASVCAAVEASIASGASSFGSVRQLLCHEDQSRVVVEPVAVSRADLAEVEIAPVDLAQYDLLHGGLVA